MDYGSDIIPKQAIVSAHSIDRDAMPLPYEINFLCPFSYIYAHAAASV